MNNYPYPDNRGQTHYPGCWRARGHHNCAVAEVERLEKAKAELLEHIQIGLQREATVNAEYVLLEKENHELRCDIEGRAHLATQRQEHAEYLRAENIRLREALTTALGELQHHADQECYCHDGEHPGTCTACTARAVIQVCREAAQKKSATGEQVPCIHEADTRCIGRDNTPIACGPGCNHYRALTPATGEWSRDVVDGEQVPYLDDTGKEGE